MATSLPLRRLLPDLTAGEAPAGTPAQLAFRQAIRAVEELREQLLSLRATQAAARQAYWRQVGPLAAATVAARRALYAPLEAALLGGYLSRAEEQQVRELLLANAHNLQVRFGEDEADILARYGAEPVPADTPPTPPPAPEPPAADNSLPPHEQAAAQARARRQQRAQQAREAKARAAETEGQSLLQNTKAAYRQLARLHHPDRAARADAQTQQAQTALMQRITAAYAAGDLAALLALLAETTGPTPPPTAEAEELLHRYTQALAQQQMQLSQQLTAARHATNDTPWSGTEKQQRAQLRQLKRDLRSEMDYLTHLRRQMQEPDDLRLLLRELTMRRQHSL